MAVWGFRDYHLRLVCLSRVVDIRQRETLMEPPQPPILPEEVIYEILSWVPAKSLLRFRCVCNSWKSLISDPNFVKLHLQRTPKSAHLALTLIDSNRKRFAMSCSLRSLIQNPSSPTIAEDISYRLRLRNNVGIGVSCNGLVCIIRDVYKRGFYEYWVRLWNPVTRLVSKKLPCLLVNLEGHQFDCAEFGLGYDSLTDTYKVVAVITDKEAKVDVSERTDVRVYSLGDSCWREIQSFPVFPISQQDERKCVNGTFNWIGLRSFNSDYEWESVTITVDQLVIVSLDMMMETYRQFSLPRGFDEVPHLEPHITVLMDYLCFSHDYKRTHFVVWQMKEFGVEKSWTQLVNVRYHDLQIDCLETPRMAPFCLCENGDVLIIVNYEEWQAILYNRRDNRVEHTKTSYVINWMAAQDYLQSLVSPRWN